jgi:hypothetical protein
MGRRTCFCEVSSTNIDTMAIISSCPISQCPIIAGDSFLYEFNVREQSGTYWYHVSEINSIESSPMLNSHSFSPIIVSKS